MKRLVIAVVALAVLTWVVFVVLAWRADAERKAAFKARIQQQDNGRIVDGGFSFCGETLRVDRMRESGAGGREFSANGLEIYFRRLPSTDADNMVLSISSDEPFAKRCFDEDVQSPIAVHLMCDPASAPAWTNFLERSWRKQTERPEHGLIVLQGDREGRVNGINFVAHPSIEAQRGGVPFQATCSSDPGVLLPAERCNVAYRKGRLGVSYSYLTRSMRPWREVDDAVRSTLKGAPSTPRCPAPTPSV